MNESIFNLNRPYTIVIRQQWLPPGVTNCMVFNFNNTCFIVEDIIWKLNKVFTKLISNGKLLEKIASSLL